MYLTLEFLFEEYRKERPVQIIRGNERATIKEDDVTIEELASAANSDKENSLESYLLKIPAGSHTHRGSYGHLGREIGIITKGTAKLTYDNKEYLLSEGDSVSFSASVPHILENAGETELIAIWFVTPAQRFTGK